MKIKLDENMPGSLAAALGPLGHDVHTVPIEQLTGQRDDRIWEAAHMSTDKKELHTATRRAI